MDRYTVLYKLNTGKNSDSRQYASYMMRFFTSNVGSTVCLKLVYTLFEMLFLSNEMREKYNFCCV